MGNAKIEDLAVGELDPGGQQVRELYAKNAPYYGVYRTAKRVCVQFADDPDLAQKQRAAIAPLGPLRTDINGLIDGWRSSDRRRARSRRRRFDRGTADGLISALSIDAAGALYQLGRVRDEILRMRTASGRFQYLGGAFVVVVLTYAVLWLTSFNAISSSIVTTAFTGDVLIAIAGGALGAFLSIAIGLNARDVLPDLQWTVNLSDALLRMTVGIVGAAIFLSLLRGGMNISLTGMQKVCANGAQACADDRWMQVFAIGVVAGFVERLVPNLLVKLGDDVPSAPSEPPTSPPPPPPSPGSAGPQMLSQTSVATSPDALGDCLCSQPLAPTDATADADLPAATGGTSDAPARGDGK